MPKNGFWFAPTLITGVSPANTVAREEIFGPVLSVMTFRTPAEAVPRPTTLHMDSVLAFGPRRVPEF
jgi:acyl-CoA reductase-like NAD-dependent aldehyde dehydrogenase